ncbi:MAG: hypothetical protein WBQ94_07335 [Terracidiphilus sp.]
MIPRPLPTTLESLRATLQKLEQTSDPNLDEASFGELKRIILNRIADLELSQTLEQARGEAAEPTQPEPPRPDELVPPPSKSEAAASPANGDSTDLEKLN